jgi:hypothetical protein
LAKKMIVVAAISLFAAGVILLRLASGLRGMALGAAVVGASLFLFWISA